MEFCMLIFNTNGPCFSEHSVTVAESSSGQVVCVGEWSVASLFFFNECCMVFIIFCYSDVKWVPVFLGVVKTIISLESILTGLSKLRK